MNGFELLALTVALVIAIMSVVALVDLFFSERIDDLIKRWMGRK